MRGFGVFLILAAILSPFDGAGWGSFAACLALGVFLLLARSQPLPPPRRRISRHYW